MVDEPCYRGFLMPTYLGPVAGSVIESDHFATGGKVKIFIDSLEPCPYPFKVRIPCRQYIMDWEGTAADSDPKPPARFTINPVCP